MATEKQMEFFKYLYDIERERTAALREISKNYIGFTSIYSAFIIFVTEKMRPETAASKTLFAAAIIPMLASFLCALYAVQVARYEGLADPKYILDGLGSNQPEDEDFFDHRIVDYTVATKENVKVNGRKAKWLSGAGYLFLAGITIHANYFLYWLAKPADFLLPK